LAAVLEFPPIDASRTQAIADALVFREFAWGLRNRVPFEVARGANNSRPLVRRHPSHNHILLDELTDVNARVETLGDEVDSTIVDRDIKRHVRVLASKAFERWPQNQRRGGLRHHEANRPRRSR